MGLRDIGSGKLPKLTATPEVTRKVKGRTRRTPCKIVLSRIYMHSHGDFPLSTTAGDYRGRECMLHWHEQASMY